MDLNVDALDEWLQSPPLLTVNDLLAFWDVQVNGPNCLLASIALDSLSVPAASTDIERAFSQGGLTVLKHCHSLNNESTRAATVISSWAAVMWLIPE
ncbi:uncharacterized protein PHACADRAFT_108614 [Phanerochaete carnosa HHB-10118-sp]|nr:uncharacterized protein PHACADRAFT_108614 [Phanerochaete carnosa HHB-10118-sp]EKM48606.1 hypothetical protein PHACADRAFT_108614 [Phanerochaete carnosa HHB-10118-sp]